MTEKNELAMNESTVYDVETGEIAPGEQVVTETSEYKIVKLPNGKFKKNMKYHPYASRKPETEEEKIELYKLFNDSGSDILTPLRNMINKEIFIDHVFIKPYQSFDENTGNVTEGVNTYIQDTEGAYYATSSKSVYHTIKGIIESFGDPTMKVKVTGTKQKNGIQIDLSILGRA